MRSITLAALALALSGAAFAQDDKFKICESFGRVTKPDGSEAFQCKTCFGKDDVLEFAGIDTSEIGSKFSDLLSDIGGNLGAIVTEDFSMEGEDMWGGLKENFGFLDNDVLGDVVGFLEEKIPEDVIDEAGEKLLSLAPNGGALLGTLKDNLFTEENAAKLTELVDYLNSKCGESRTVDDLEACSAAVVDDFKIRITTNLEGGAVQVALVGVVEDLASNLPEEVVTMIENARNGDGFQFNADGSLFERLSDMDALNEFVPTMMEKLNSGSFDESLAAEGIAIVGGKLRSKVGPYVDDLNGWLAKAGFSHSIDTDYLFTGYYVENGKIFKRLGEGFRRSDDSSLASSFLPFVSDFNTERDVNLEEISKAPIWDKFFGLIDGIVGLENGDCDMIIGYLLCDSWRSVREEWNENQEVDPGDDVFVNPLLGEVCLELYFEVCTPGLRAAIVYEWPDDLNTPITLAERVLNFGDIELPTNVGVGNLAGGVKDHVINVVQNFEAVEFCTPEILPDKNICLDIYTFESDNLLGVSFAGGISFGHSEDNRFEFEAPFMGIKDNVDEEFKCPDPTSQLTFSSIDYHNTGAINFDEYKEHLMSLGVDMDCVEEAWENVIQYAGNDEGSRRLLASNSISFETYQAYGEANREAIHGSSSSKYSGQSVTYNQMENYMEDPEYQESSDEGSPVAIIVGVGLGSVVAVAGVGVLVYKFKDDPRLESMRSFEMSSLRPSFSMPSMPVIEMPRFFKKEEDRKSLHREDLPF